MLVEAERLGFPLHELGCLRQRLQNRLSNRQPALIHQRPTGANHWVINHYRDEGLKGLEFESISGPRHGQGCQQTHPVNWRKRRISAPLAGNDVPNTSDGTWPRPISAESIKRKCMRMFGLDSGLRTASRLSTKTDPQFETEVVAPRKYGFTTFSLNIP